MLILGAGVSGLSTGILLLDAGHDVTIWAREVPPHTTSDVAAAFWYPYLCNPREKATRWAGYTDRYLREHALADPTSGCILRTAIELFDHVAPEPWWAEAVSAHRRPTADELPPGYVDGYEVEVVVMDSGKYMAWLVSEFERRGGRIEIRALTDVQDAFAAAPVVINCTGLRSRDLFGDDRVYPVRGQVVVVRPTGADRVQIVDSPETGIHLIVPRIDDIVLGGTAQPNRWDLEPDSADTSEILGKATELDPALADADIIDVKVGLRPARDEVRLEVERFGGNTVVHNYGHGGAGYTLSWGCARDVVELVDRLV